MKRTSSGRQSEATTTAATAATTPTTMTAAAALSPLEPAAATPAPAGPGVLTPASSSTSRHTRPSASLSLTSPATAATTTMTTPQGGKGFGRSMRRLFGGFRPRVRASTEDIGGLGEELGEVEVEVEVEGQEDGGGGAGGPVGVGVEGSLLSSSGGPGGIVVPPSPLRSVAAALGSNSGVSVGQGQGRGLGLEKSGSARMAMGRSPTLSVSGAAATGAAGPNSAAVAPTEGGELDVETPRTLGSILPTSRAKEAKAAAEAAAAAAVAATSPLLLLRSASAGAAVLTSQQAAGLLPPAVAVAALPLRVPPLPSSAVAAEELVVVQELRRRLEEAEARASSSEEAVRRLASEVWALRRQVALLSGAEKEGDGEGEDGNCGGTYYDVVRVGDGAAGVLSGLGAKEPPPLASVAAGEAEAALMPLPKINPALFIAEGDIVVGPRVGIGAFGEVWKGLYRGRPVAIKCFRAQPPTGAGAGAGNASMLLAATAEMVAGEIRLMERVGGKPHVLPLEGVFVSRGTREVALVLPFMAHGSLHDLLLDTRSPGYRPSVSMNALVRFALQAAHGVRGLHQEGVIHRDLACRNLLVDAAMNVFVSDFGFARLKPPTTITSTSSANGTNGGHGEEGQQQPQPLHHDEAEEAEEEEALALDHGGNASQAALGPVRWEAPESLRRKEYSEKTDAFAFGVCLYEMVARALPWKGLTHAMVAHRVLAGRRLPVPINADPALAEVMRRCWEQDPRRRPNFEFIYRRLKARHTQLQNEEREVSWERGSVADLRRGCTFHKLPYLKGSPHERFFKVSEDLRRLKWRFLPTRTSLAFFQRARELDPVRPPTKQVFLTEVQDIRLGMRTANFSRSEGLPPRYAGMASFSIVTRDRTIDLLCPDAHAVDRWARGLAFLVLRLRPPPLPLDDATLTDPWATLALLRRGGFLLKFGQIGTPHERYFRVSADMRQLLWRRGEEEGGGEGRAGGGRGEQQGQQYRTVDLSAIRTVRLFAPLGRGFRGGSIGSSGGGGGGGGMAVGGLGGGKPSLGPLAWGVGVEEYQLGFSLLNASGQAELNLVAPNARVHAVWAQGLARIVEHFSVEGQRRQQAALEEGMEGLEGPATTDPQQQQQQQGQLEGPFAPLPLYDRGEYLALAYLEWGAAGEGEGDGVDEAEAEAEEGQGQRGGGRTPLPPLSSSITPTPTPKPPQPLQPRPAVGEGEKAQQQGQEEEELHGEEEDELGLLATMQPPPKLSSVMSSSLVTSDDDDEVVVDAADAETESDEENGVVVEEEEKHGVGRSGADGAVATDDADAAGAVATTTSMPPPQQLEEQEEEAEATPLPPPQQQQQQQQPPPPLRPLPKPAPAVLLTGKLSDSGPGASAGSNVDPEGNYAAATSYLTFLQEPEVPVGMARGPKAKEEGRRKEEA